MRRIVTENGSDGQSRVMHIEEVVPVNTGGLPTGGVVWESDATRPLGSVPRAGAHTIDFLAGGVKAMYLEIPPDASVGERLGHSIFHRTGTLDFLLLLEGQLSLELDEEMVRLEVGDVVVQRDTNHAWRNLSDKVSYAFAVISIPAQPLDP